jgi:hypothetical protein
MEIDQTEQTMTVQEIATALNVSRQTVTRAASRVFEESIFKTGKTTHLTKDQAFSIARELGVGQPVQPVQKRGQAGQVDYEQLAITIAKAVVIALRETGTPAQEQKQIAAPAISTRDSYRRAINMASKRTGASQQELYGVVASELYYRCHVNVRVKAKNSGSSMIDIIEQEGLLRDAIAIADEM